MTTTDPQHTTPTVDAVTDIRAYWENLDPGLKARAMHDVYEAQQRRVIEVQRAQMETQEVLAMAAVKARALAELGRDDDVRRLIQEEIEPARARLRELQREMEEATALLNVYQTLGRGII